MADVFELELHDLHEEDPNNRAADSDDDIIEIDEVCVLTFRLSITTLHVRNTSIPNVPPTEP